MFISAVSLVILGKGQLFDSKQLSDFYQGWYGDFWSVERVDSKALHEITIDDLWNNKTDDKGINQKSTLAFHLHFQSVYKRFYF